MKREKQRNSVIDGKKEVWRRKMTRIADKCDRVTQKHSHWLKTERT